MNSLSKERLEEISAATTLEPCDYEEVYDSIKTGEIMSMARELLALRKEREAAVPVACLYHTGQVLTRAECNDDKVFAICCKVETPLYAAPPSQPVAVPVIMSDDQIHDYLQDQINYWHGEAMKYRKMTRVPDPQPVAVPDEVAIFNSAIDACRSDDGIDERAWNRGVLAVIHHFNACRAAMLQGKAEPVNPDPAYDIEEFGIFKVTTGDKGLDIEISDFHFSSGTAPEQRNKPMIVKYAIQAIINRLQNYCEGLEDSPLEEVFSINSNLSSEKEGVMDKQAIYQKLEELVSEAHQFACSLEIGDERIEAFEFYEALRRLQRNDCASQMLAATSPFAPYFEEDWDNDDRWDDD